MTSSLDTIRIVSIVSILVMGIIAGIIPLYVTMFRDHPKVVHRASAFAGGVFLFMGLVHILPDATEDLATEYGAHHHQRYRFSYLTAGCGYIVLLALQRIIFINHGHGHHGHHDHHHHHYHHHARHSGGQLSEVEMAGVSTMSQESLASNHASSSADSAMVNKGVKASPNGKFNRAAPESKEGNVSPGGAMDDRVSVAVAVPSPGQEQPQSPSSSSSEEIDFHNSTRPSDRFVAEIEELQVDHAAHTKKISSYVLLLALGVHGLSEGIALGLQKRMDSAVVILVAILAHKWAESLALGVNFQKTTIALKMQLLFIVAFSLSTPVGVALGWVLQAMLPAVASGYLMALCCGTFLYIGCTEVVSEEFPAGERHWVRFLCFIIGAAGIYLVTVYLA